MKNINEKIKKAPEKQQVRFPQRFISVLAEEVAKTIVKRLPGIIPHRRKKETTRIVQNKKIILSQ